MKAALTIHGGRWSFLSPDGRIGIRGAEVALEVNGRWLQSSQVAVAKVVAAGRRQDAPGDRQATRLVLEYSEPPLKAEVCFESLQTSAMLVRVELTNRSGQAVTLNQCHLCDVRALDGGALSLGRSGGQTTFFKFSTWMSRSHVVRLAKEDSPVYSDTVGHLWNADEPVALNTSFLTFTRMSTGLSVRHAAGEVTDFTALCSFTNFALAPGASIASETLYVELSADPHATLEAYAEAVASVYRPRVRKDIPAGWLGWAWVDPIGGGETYQSVVERNVRAIGRRLGGLGVQYVWISMGNLPEYLPGNWLKINRKQFPAGMEALVKMLADSGLKLGFWIAPFWCCPRAGDQFDRNKDNLVRDESGKPVKTCNWDLGQGTPAEVYALDPSHPRTLAYLTDVFSEYRKQGVRYYMIDFLHSGMVPGRHHDNSLIAGFEMYRHALQAVRQAAGDETHLLSSSGPTFQNIEIVDAARIGSDFGEGRPVAPGEHYPGTLLIGTGTHPYAWHYALVNLAATWFTHNRFYLNDSNVLTVDKPVPLAEAQINTTIFALSGGPVMLGDDIDCMSPERLELVRKCLPRTGDVALPVDLFRTTAPDLPSVFRLRIAMPWGLYNVVAVFNASGAATVQTLTRADLGVEEGRPYLAYDFWNEEYLGRFDEALTVEVPASAVRVLRLQCVRNHPWLLSTDMHVLQGQVEAPHLRWDAATMTLSGTVRRAVGLKGNMFIIAPRGFKPIDYAGLWVAKDHKDGSVIIRKEFTFDMPAIDWEIGFEPLPT